MESGSSFLNQLQNNAGNIVSNYPSTIWTVYVGDYDLWWRFIFDYPSNNRVVSVSSETYLGYSHLYLFNDVHVTGIPTFGTAELGTQLSPILLLKT